MVSYQTHGKFFFPFNSRETELQDFPPWDSPLETMEGRKYQKAQRKKRKEGAPGFATAQISGHPGFNSHQPCAHVTLQGQSEFMGSFLKIIFFLNYSL